jgi:copper transport protein
MIKWFGLAAITVWLGGIGFWICVFMPSRKLLGPKTSQSLLSIQNAQTRICKIIWISVAVFAVAQCLSLMEQAAVFSGLSWMSALSPLTLWTIVTRTNYGEWWGVRMMAAIVLFSVSRPYFSSRTWTTETSWPPTKTSFLAACWVTLGGLILISFPLTGHARGVPHAPLLAIASDWAHLAATAVWIGGLVFLLAVTSIHGDEQEQQFLLLRELVGRFSRLAQMCVATLILTGVYAAWLHIPHWNSFLTTSYGRALTVKILLIIPILLIGLVNWQRVLPALARFVKEAPLARKWRERLPTLLRFESFLGAAILLAVAFLTGLPPATAVTVGGPVNLSQTNGDAGIKVNLILDSAQIGTRHAVVTLADSSGHRVDNAQEVTLYLVMQDMDMGLETIQAKSFPDGSYQADLPLTMAGKWKVSVEVTPARGDAFVTEFELSSGF